MILFILKLTIIVIFDLYIDKNRPWILDVSPLNETSNLCLFSWDDITNIDQSDIASQGILFSLLFIHSV